MGPGAADTAAEPDTQGAHRHGEQERGQAEPGEQRSSCGVREVVRRDVGGKPSGPAAEGG